MPALYWMTWESGPRRWRKMHRGHVYTVSASQLGTPGTKEASRQAANAWWAAKRAELDGIRPPHQHADYLDLLARRRDWSRRHDLAEESGLLTHEIVRVEGGGTPAFLPPNEPPDFHDAPPADTSYRRDDEPPIELVVRRMLADEMTQATDPLDPVWQDRVRRDQAAPVPDDRTVGYHVEQYISDERGRYKSGELSASEFDAVQRHMTAFKDWIKGDTTIDVINAVKWHKYYQYVRDSTYPPDYQKQPKKRGSVPGKAYSAEYRKKRFAVARSFVQSLADLELIPLPKNLYKRRHRFGGGAKAIPTMTVDEVETLIREAPGQLKLHLLLMLNCGLYPQDISDLACDEVDWDEGRIIRKRSKTGDKEEVPVVDYKLWPLTWELMQRYGNREGDRVLLTESGKLWVRDSIDDGGKRHRTNAIQSNYNHVKRRLDFKKPMAWLRKTSATMIESHAFYGRYKIHFLGQAPKTIADRHYAAPSKSLFDEVLAWLGKQYGFVS